MSAGQTIRNIRRRLGVSQAELAQAMGCSAVNVHFYERGQRVPPERAGKLIAFAASKGLQLSYDHVYGGTVLPEMPRAVPGVA